MRLLLSILLITTFVSSAIAEDTEVKTENTDVKTNHTELKGSATWVSDAPLEKITGTASGSASLHVNKGDLSKLSGTLTFSVDSMKSGSDMRDQHIKEKDWLDATQYPEITYVVKEVKPLSEKGMVDVTGDFTLHGVTKSLSAKAKVMFKEKKDKTLMKIKAKFKISLADYKVEGTRGKIGSKVGKEIALKVTLRGIVK